jgi:signal transduction histidine kinase
MGLDIVRTVLNAHQGAIELLDPPQGASFRLTLPASQLR